MTLNQLRTFIAVADTGSVRGAAERLVVTQPAVSGSLRGLQQSPGAQLVESDGRGLRLSAAGEAFAAYVRRILGLLEEAVSAAAHGTDPAQGQVRIAAVTTAAEQLVPRALARFRRDYPHVDTRLRVGTRDEVWEWMADRHADVALAGRPPIGSGLAVRALAPNRLVLVAVPDIAAGARELSDLSSTTWLFHEEGSGTRATVEALLEQAELHPPTMTLGSNGAVVEGAVAGLGVALVSSIAVADELSRKELVVIEADPTPLDRPWHAVTQSDAAPTAMLFVERLVAGGGMPPFEFAHEMA